MSYLDRFQTKITPSEVGFTITYVEGEYSGTVNYSRYDMNNLLMKGKPVYLMTKADMGDIIECVHQKTPLSSDDFRSIDMEIRTHSRELLESVVGKR